MRRILPMVLIPILFAMFVSATDLPLLEGPLTSKEILTELAPYKKAFLDYQPDKFALASIKNLDNVEIYVFFGSWCSDSQEYVPRFVKILKTLSFPEERTYYIAVNREKQDPEGLATEKMIEKVPTFIVIRDGLEIGRIVEQPDKSLEKDLAAILGQPASAD